MTAEAVVRKFFELYTDGDSDGIRELVDPDVVVRGTEGGLDAYRVIHGAGALLEYMQEVEQPWEQYEVELERVIASGPTAVAFLRERGRGRDALEVQSETAMIFRLRSGRIAEMKGYLDRDQALAVAGVEGPR